jgi:hypothetical protein
MLHLVKDASTSIENNLIWVKSIRDKLLSWWFNLTIFIVVVGSFAYFLYSSYGTAVPDELKSIPFEPRTWNNAVRNVPTTEYGQIPQIETGSGIQGIASGNRGTAF